MGIDTDGRAGNHPTENLETIRLCNVCGFPLRHGSVEKLIGVHTWCVAAVAQRPKPIRGPVYGKKEEER